MIMNQSASHYFLANVEATTMISSSRRVALRSIPSSDPARVSSGLISSALVSSALGLGLILILREGCW